MSTEQAGRSSSRRGSPGDDWHVEQNSAHPRSTRHTTGTFHAPAESDGMDASHWERVDYVHGKYEINTNKNSN